MAETTPLLRVQLLTGARGFKSLSVRHEIRKIAYFKAFYQNLNPLADRSREFLYVAADVAHPEAQTAKAKFCRL